MNYMYITQLVEKAARKDKTKVKAKQNKEQVKLMEPFEKNM